MTIKAAAAKAAMSEKSAHKYLRSVKLSSEMKGSRTYRASVGAIAGV